MLFLVLIPWYDCFGVTCQSRSIELKVCPSESYSCMRVQNVLEGSSKFNPNLRGAVSFISTPPLPLLHCWFSLNNSEIVKAVTRIFCSIQSHFISDIHAKFGVPNLPQSSDIGQSSDRCIFNFCISGQSLTKENGHNSRTSNDVDIKLGSVTIIQMRNKTASKNLTMTSCR